MDDELASMTSPQFVNATQEAGEEGGNLGERVRDFLSQPHMALIFSLGVLAIVANVMSLLALYHIRNRLNSRYRLIISLTMSDLFIGASVVLHSVNRVMNPLWLTQGSDVHRIASSCSLVLLRALNTTALNISLLNLMGMSIDHYIAISRPLHYPKLMCESRVRCMILALWAVAGVCGFSDVISGVFHVTDPAYAEYNYCEVTFLNGYHAEYIMLAIAVVCLVVMSVMYSSIYRRVRNRRAPGERNAHKLDDTRNQRALVTTLLIMGSFIICWIPGCLFQVVMIIRVRSVGEDIYSDPQLIHLLRVDKYLLLLLLLNSICDPIIYTVRTSEVQLGYRRMFSCCLASTQAQSRSSRHNVTSSSLIKQLSMEQALTRKQFILDSNLKIEQNGICEL